MHPLLPENAWDWFALDNVPYHGHALSIAWDRTGQKFGRGAGLSIDVDGQRVASAPDLRPLTTELP